VTPDVNVLVAASRTDHPHHGSALSWLRGALADAQRGRRLDLLPMVATGFLRLVSHPKVFSQPTPPEPALAFVEALLEAPGVQMASLGEEWPALLRLCRSKTLAGNAIPDAWIAAAVKSKGLHLVTFDRDFARLLDSADYTLLSP
jgi:uncharacterized protein